MARKWHPFFGKVQSVLNRGWKFILISVFATITILNLQGGLPVFAHQPVPETVAQIQSSDGKMRLEEGSRFYERLQFAEAETAWQAAVRLLSEEEQALAFSYLALAQLRQSKLDEAETSIQDSIRVLNEVTTPGTSERNQIIHARILTTEAQINLAKNQPELADHALKQLAEATAIYEKLGQQKWMIASQINQAQGMLQLGMYREALKTLKNLEGTILYLPEPEIQLSGILNLGKTYRAIGVLDQSYCILKAGQKPGQENPEIDLELGNTAQAIGNRLKDQLDSITEQTSDPIFTEQQTPNCEFPVKSGTSVNAWDFYKKAKEFYQQVSNFTGVKAETQVQAMLNNLSLALDLKDAEELEEETSQLEREAKELAPQGLQRIELLSLNREKVYDRIHLARSLARLNQELSQNQLETALAEARELADKRAQAYAIGELGRLKQQQGNWTEAEQWTRQAIAITPWDATDIRYQWEWQLGQILKEEGRPEDAIRHYTEAVDLLQRVRQNLVAIAAGMGEMNADLQFDFRDRVEPVYRELVGLLLQSELTVPNPIQANIQKARDVILEWQKAEISNFMLCDFYAKEQVITIEDFVELNNKHTQSVAIIYPIVFSDTIGVILKMPNDAALKYYQSSDKQNVGELIKELSTSLQSDLRPIEESKNIYNLIIKPLEENEKLKRRVNTLVFVLDSQLRSIPMAALYDGTHYLVEDYSIALSTGWQKDSPSKRLQNIKFNPLISGLSEDPQFGQFEPLPYVKEEINHIKNHLKLSDNQIKLNQDFTRESMKNELSALYYNLVHMATHGQFSSNPQNTFLITAPSPNAVKNSVDNRLNVNELDDILRNRDLTGFNDMELLVLSACETAKGDTRAALGLAGVAIRAGAHSTIASLWNLADNSTSEFMNLFYKELVNKKLNKAEILQEIQKQFLSHPTNRKYKDPSSWAPYVLIGDWL